MAVAIKIIKTTPRTEMIFLISLEEEGIEYIEGVREIEGEIGGSDGEEDEAAD